MHAAPFFVSLRTPPAGIFREAEALLRGQTREPRACLVIPWGSYGNGTTGQTSFLIRTQI